MSLNSYRDEVRDFIVKAGFDAEGIDKLIFLLEEEFEYLKAYRDDDSKLQHQVYDLLYLLFEIAAKRDLDIDYEWQKGRDKKEKYIQKKGST